MSLQKQQQTTESGRTKRIVTVQDISCFGKCSITMALPILSAYGIETAILPSALLSTHTGGFTGYTCLDLTEEMPKIVEHWKKEGFTFDGIYTGYIGDARQFALIKQLKHMLTNDGILIVDPAMADHGKLYSALNDDIVDGMRGLVCAADVILPNLTETAFLLGESYQESYTREEIKDRLIRLSEMGPDTVIITGVSFEEGSIGAAAYQKSTDTMAEYFTEYYGKNFYHGTGDAFSSIAVADILNGASLADTIKDACEFVIASIRATEPSEDQIYGVNFEKVLAER